MKNQKQLYNYLQSIIKTITIITTLIINLSFSPPDSIKNRPLNGVDNKKLLLDLATKVYANQPDKSIQYAFAALDLAKKYHDEESEAQALKVIGDIYLSANFYQKALPYFNKALPLFQKQKNISAINITNQNIGDIYYKLNLNDSSLLFYNKALKGFQKKKSKLGEGTCYLKIGNSYWVSNNYDKSLENYLNALNIFEEIKYPNGLARVYLNIGLLYYVTEYYEKSLEYYNKSKSILKETYDQEILADLYNRLGDLYDKKLANTESLKYYNMSLAIYDSLKNDLNKAKVYQSKSNILHKQGKNEEAIELAKKALQIGQNYDRSWFNASIHNYLAIFYLDSKLYSQAIFHLKEANNLAIRLKSWTLLKENYLNYSRYYTIRGDYKTALEYLQKFQQMNDSIQNKEKNERIAQLQSKFESDRSKKELIQKEKEIQKSKIKLQKQKFQLYIFAIGVLFVLLLSFALYRQYKLLEIKGKKIERINAELDQRVRERTSALRLTQYSIDQASDPIFWLFPNSRYVFANKAACEKLGYSTEELVNLSITNIIPKFTIQDWHEFWKIIKTKKSFLFETFHQKKNGKTFPVEIVLNYIDHEGNEFAFAFVRDISERKYREENLKKAKEKAEEADKLKSSFLANMSHEIRTPMNAIIGFSDLLINEDYSTEEKYEFGNLIKSSGNTLLKLIDDIIDISIMEAGHLKLNKSHQFVNNHLNEILLYFQEEKLRQSKPNVEILLNIPENSDNVIIDTDPVRFRQVINNLVGNALKFTEKGFIEIGYKFEKDPVLRFYVKDSGIGIRPEKIDLIFERFNKLDDDGRIYAGTGLGLTISKKIVEELGGFMFVESEYENGSTFNFTLPYSIENRKKTKELIEFENSVDSAFNWMHKKIMIVEDVVSNYIYLEALLQKTKATISWAKTGTQAIKLCNELKPDLILMDIQLPELSGYEATRQIRSVYPNIPIIAQTAYAFSGEKERIIKAGCNAYITKPIKTEVLFTVLQKFLT